MGEYVTRNLKNGDCAVRKHLNVLVAASQLETRSGTLTRDTVTNKKRSTSCTRTSSDAPGLTLPDPVIKSPHVSHFGEGRNAEQKVPLKTPTDKWAPQTRPSEY